MCVLCARRGVLLRDVKHPSLVLCYVYSSFRAVRLNIEYEGSGEYCVFFVGHISRYKQTSSGANTS